MKTSTGRKLAIGTLLTLLLTGNAFTAGSTSVPPPNTPQSSTCSTIDDATLAKNVRDELAKTLSTAVLDRITITAKNRVVTIKGSVVYLGLKAHITTVARKVKCVRRVINKIRWVPPFEACLSTQRNCCCDGDCECIPASQQCPICRPRN